MAIQLVCTNYPEMFGLPRYNVTLVEYLQLLGFPFFLSYPSIPKSVLSLNKICRGLDCDIQTVFTNYPLITSTNKEDLVHLTNHTLSTLYILNHFEKSIVTVHDIDSEWEHFSSRYSGTRYAIYRILHRLCLIELKKSDFIITDTDHVRKHIQLTLTISGKKIFVIPLGIDHDVFNTSSGRYPGITEFSSQGPIILHVGTFAPRKNFENLVKAFAELVKVIPSAILVKVGRQNWPLEFERITKLIHKFDLTNRVIFLQDLTDIDLARLYRTVDLLVYPSFYEGFGLPVLEAMACGTPVITSNTSSLPEIAENAALLVDPNDVEEIGFAMRQVLSDSELAQELRERGLARTAEFTWEKTARQTIALYEKVLGESIH
jgi:glycosyltransferase involved in cell wall biosynthesis